jgi:hypothetical protein
MADTPRSKIGRYSDFTFRSNLSYLVSRLVRCTRVSGQQRQQGSTKMMKKTGLKKTGLVALMGLSFATAPLSAIAQEMKKEVGTGEGQVDIVAWQNRRYIGRNGGPDE